MKPWSLKMARESSGWLVEIRGVWKSYAAAPVLREVWLEIPPGQILALLGPNGAGKSTLLRLIAGLLRPTRGEVRIGGRAPAADPLLRRFVGLAGHVSFLYGHLTAIENLAFYADLYGLSKDRAEALLEQFDLAPSRHHLVRTLSRGLVQRLSLARAMLHDPRVLLLDEPFTGLDATAARRLMDRLGELRTQQRIVVMATHAWQEAREAADHVAVLVGGRLAAHEPAAAVDGARILALYGGLR